MATLTHPRRFSAPLRLLGLVLIMALSASCEQSEVVTPRPVVVQIAGATSMHPVLVDLASAFTQQHSNVLVDIRGGGSALGEMRVRNGRSTLAASTLMPDAGAPRAQTAAVNPAPVGTATSAPALAAGTSAAPSASSDSSTPPAVATQPPPLNRVPIGVDAIAVIVHADNPLTAFTALQLRDIFSGRILGWEELGGEAGEIVLVSREDGSGTRHAFESRIMQERDVSLTAVVMPSSADVVDYVSKNPQAIGYVSTSHLTELGRVQPDTGVDDEVADETPSVQVAALDGVTPSDETVRGQSYPLVQPLFLVTNGTPQGWARQFIDFALSPAGQAIVDRYHTPVR